MTVTHKVVKASDHCPLIINTNQLAAKGKMPFLFESFWAMKPGCREVVENSWLVRLMEIGFIGGNGRREIRRRI